MQQYNAIKAKYPDAMLLFRVGDFYETFGEDAIQASKILDIILTKRGAGSQSDKEVASRESKEGLAGTCHQSRGSARS